MKCCPNIAEINPQAEFENAEVAKKIIEKWDGKSMGRGPNLSVTPF